MNWIFASLDNCGAIIMAQPGPPEGNGSLDNRIKMFSNQKYGLKIKSFQKFLVEKTSKSRVLGFLCISACFRSTDRWSSGLRQKILKYK